MTFQVEQADMYKPDEVRLCVGQRAGIHGIGRALWCLIGSDIAKLVRLDNPENPSKNIKRLPLYFVGCQLKRFMWVVS